MKSKRESTEKRSKCPWCKCKWCNSRRSSRSFEFLIMNSIKKNCSLLTHFVKQTGNLTWIFRKRNSGTLKKWNYCQNPKNLPKKVCLEIYFWQIQGSWFQMRQWFFKITFQKYINKVIFAPNLRISILTRNLASWQLCECWP